MFVLDWSMSLILRCHVWQKYIKPAFIFYLLMQFCCSSDSAAEKFHIHNTFCLELFIYIFFNSKGVKYDSISEVVSDNPSHKTLRGQRKECCLSTGLVEGKKPWCDNLNLIHRIDWGIVSSPFFLLAFPFVNTKLRWPINITWCGDAKQELMTGVCVSLCARVSERERERACVRQVPMGFCLDRRA